MPARINITSGITAGSSHWIERRVVRIGSEDCEICLPSVDLAGHAVTLEFRDGQYHVHNKSRNSFRINEQTLDSQQSKVWHPGQQLVLAPDVVLVLQTETDPTPAPRADEAYDIPDYDEPSGAEDSGSQSVEADESEEKPSNLMPLIVIALCIVGSILLLMRSSRENPVKTAVTFETIISQRDKASPQLVERLQYAQAALVRGDQEAALVRFNRLRDLLVQQEQSFRDQGKKVEIQILNYVTYQLEQLD